MHITAEHVEKYNITAPRYTSYPTAPAWKDGFPEADYRAVLSGLVGPLSIYIHIPFCESMCYYCGCNVTIRKQKPEVADEYIDFLSKEIRLASNGQRVKQLHIGGGTPNFLSEKQLRRLTEVIHQNFKLDPDAEISIELDPRHPIHFGLLKELGFNRLSMGIQDFNPEVQKAINRIQPFDLVSHLMNEIRRLNFHSVNFDLIYGLPHQHSLDDTIQKTISLKPDRIALYSYAHVPWLKPHQNLMPSDAFPSDNQKIELFLQARNQLIDGGYLAIAMDHFALKTDSLATGPLYRNFMGYTLHPTDDFVGFGVSSIGFCSNHYVQNTRDLKEYYDRLSRDELPVSRGLKLSQDDIIRQWTINQMMCHFKIDKSEFQRKFSLNFNDYFDMEFDPDLVKQNQSHVVATELGRLFVRNICVKFDAYLLAQKFSKTV